MPTTYFDPDSPDEVRQAVRKLFGDPPPRDVVPPSASGLTREALERQSDLYGKRVTGTIPGDVITDPDGIPIGMTENRSAQSQFGGTYITQDQADRLGVTPGELAGIFIIQNEN